MVAARRDASRTRQTPPVDPDAALRGVQWKFLVNSCRKFFVGFLKGGRKDCNCHIGMEEER